MMEGVNEEEGLPKSLRCSAIESSDEIQELFRYDLANYA